MVHKPIIIESIELSFPHKLCFENFSHNILYGERVAIIGRNGIGKSSLLNIIRGKNKPTSGKVTIPEDVNLSYIPQIIEDDNCSGGERFNNALTSALSSDPNLLLLDEPTNHLDSFNRKSLMRMLNRYVGTLIVVSHDVELIHSCIDTLWHIDNGKVYIFSGNYDDYMNEIRLKRSSIEERLWRLNREKKDMHDKLMKEQERAAKSKNKGCKSIDERKWPTVVSKAKVQNASETSGRKKAAITQRKDDLLDELNDLRLPEIIVPTFSLNSDITNGSIVQITDGAIGYAKDHVVVDDINITILGNDRVAILGNNGSGKSTVIKGLLGDTSVDKSGEWYVPNDIGYLDQHYNTLDFNKSVLESISDLKPEWAHMDVRKHLNDFLFKKNEEVNAKVLTLSGGERARLSFAQIAVCVPKLLILDEVTNNIDLETKEHIVDVLRSYPGAMVVISHDNDFLKKIRITASYTILDGKIRIEK